MHSLDRLARGSGGGMKSITVDYTKRLAEEPGTLVDVPNFVVSVFLPLHIYGQWRHPPHPAIDTRRARPSPL
jgi:hypothetical protein